jgi:hypothetical protein
MGGFDLRSGRLRSVDSKAAIGFVAFAGLYVLAAAGFYWLMQPSVAQNRGVAAYQPPPKAVVSYVPWVPPPPDVDAPILTARPAPEAEQASATPAKTDTKTQETSRAVPRERHVRARPAPRYGYDVGRAFAFRPWF